MDELTRRVNTLKQKIRMAINESQLPLVIAENILDAIKAEIIQQEYYTLAFESLSADSGETNESTNTEEVEENG